MKDQLLYAGLVLVFAAMAAVFGYGAYSTWAESRRLQDFELWLRAPGILESLQIEPTLYRFQWQYVVASQYSYVVDGTTFTGNLFDLDKPVFKTADQAKTFAESSLGIAHPAPWRAVRRGTLDGWAFQTGKQAVSVRHSPRDPSVSTLTSTPPMAEFLDWVVIVVLSLLALATGLGSIALAGAVFSRTR